MSDKTNNLEAIKLLSAIQAKINCPKNQYNKFGKYNYRSLEDIFEGLKPIIKDDKVAFTVDDEIVQVGDRYYIKAVAKFHCEYGVIENTAYAREADKQSGMADAQITGSTSSYARKYAMNGLLCLDDNKDPDTNELKNQIDNTPVSKKQRAEEAKKDTNQSEIIKYYTQAIGKIKSNSDWVNFMSVEQHQKFVATLDKRADANKLGDFTGIYDLLEEKKGNYDLGKDEIPF